MTRAGVVGLLLAALVAPGPAAAAGGLHVLEQGYTQIELASQAWAFELEDTYEVAPQTDGAGNLYVLDGGGETPGGRILRVSETDIQPFLEVEGPGRPRLAAMTFDGENNMVVVVYRTARDSRGAPVRERVYYKIKGFPQARPALAAAGTWTLTAEEVNPWLLSLWFALFAAALLAIMGRQALRDAAWLRRRYDA